VILTNRGAKNQAHRPTEQTLTSTRFDSNSSKHSTYVRPRLKRKKLSDSLHSDRDGDGELLSRRSLDE